MTLRRSIGNSSQNEARFPKCDGYVCLFDCESQYGSSSNKDNMMQSFKLSFDYEIYVHLSTSLPTALKALEEKILINVAKELHLDVCDIQKQLSDYSDGLISSLASSPTDVVDRNNVNCIVEIDQKPDNTVCIPIQGYMATDYRGVSQAQASSRLYQILEKGMTDGLYVTENIHKLSFIGSRTPNFGSLESKSSKQLSVMTASGVIFVALFVGLISTLFFVKHGKQTKDENEDYDHQSLSTLTFDKGLTVIKEGGGKAYNMEKINDNFKINPVSKGGIEFATSENSSSILPSSVVPRPSTPINSEIGAHQSTSKRGSMFKTKKKKKFEKFLPAGNSDSLSTIMEGSRDSSTQTSHRSNSHVSQDSCQSTGTFEESKSGISSSSFKIVRSNSSRSNSSRSNSSRSNSSSKESDSHASSSFHNETSPKRTITEKFDNEEILKDSSYQFGSLSLSKILYDISEDKIIT